MKNESWFVLEITIDARAAEAVEFAFNELDADGTEINNLGKTSQETVTVIGYFSKPFDTKNVREQLNEALRIYGFDPDAVKDMRERRLGNVDWLYEWKKHWKPTRTGNFTVAPTWFEIQPAPDEIVIWIDPEMAFGTGTHATTQLCLKAIEENYLPEMSFLDVGTGTGILAIGARKLKSRVESRESREHSLTLNSFVACDTDTESVEIARRNAELNETGGIEFYVGSISDETPEFDFVCANLTADVIVPILPLLVQKAKRILVLSGILREQEDLIASELKKFQIENFKTETDGEWISVQLKTER